MRKLPDGTPAEADVLQVHVPAPPRKRPRQPRSLLLVQSLQKAGWDILEKEGRAALTVQRLAERSGVAVSSIYEYFPTMESLITEIAHEQLLEVRRRLMVQIRELPATATLFEGLMLMMRMGLAEMHRWATIDAEFHARTVHYDELVRLDLVKAREFWSGIATPVLLERFRDEVIVADRDKALFVFYQFVRAVPRAVSLEKPEYLVQEDTAVLLARMLHALLTAPAA